MTSLCRHSSAQEIVNWVTTADGCVHTDDSTQLDSFVASVVCIFLGITDIIRMRGKAKRDGRPLGRSKLWSYFSPFIE